MVSHGDMASHRLPPGPRPVPRGPSVRPPLPHPVAYVQPHGRRRKRPCPEAITRPWGSTLPVDLFGATPAACLDSALTGLSDELLESLSGAPLSDGATCRSGSGKRF